MYAKYLWIIGILKEYEYNYVKFRRIMISDVFYGK